MGRSLFKRDLAKYGKLITLQDRAITPPDEGSTSFDETFTENTPDVPALIITKRGKVLFDGVNTDAAITHKFCIEFIEGVTAETWVLFKGRRFDIVDTENVGEQDYCLVLRCTDKGTGEAAKA